MLFQLLMITFFARSGEKVDQRSVVGMSRYANAFTLTPLAEWTHPVIASLDIPLLQAKKRK
jgi:hypothetical protein